MASIQNFFIRLFLKAVVKKDKMEVVSIRSIRKSLDKLTGLSRLPKAVSYEKVNCDGVSAEWAIPDNLENKGAVLYLHGGGYVSGSIKTHQSLVGAIARASKTKCLSVEYRLAPENPFPDGLNDTITVYRWLLNQGFDPKKIVIAGDSAGGGLAVAALLKLRDEKAPQPAAGVCLSPWLDLECTGNSATALADKDPMVAAPVLRRFGLLYTTQQNLRHPYTSPLYADLTGLPPLFIQVSDSEVLYDDTTRFEQKAKAAGVTIEVEVWKKMVHVWQAYLPMLPEALKAIKKAGAYISDKTK